MIHHRIKNIKSSKTQQSVSPKRDHQGYLKTIKMLRNISTKQYAESN